MSERVERRLLELLDNPKYSPYGNAIPGLEDLGDSSERNDTRTVSMTIAAKDSDEDDRFTISRLSEFVQTDMDLLGKLAAAGIVYGAEVSILPTPRGVRVTAEGQQSGLELIEEIADSIVVKRH